MAERRRARALVRIDPRLHAKAKAAAALERMSLEDWLDQAIRCKLTLDGHEEPPHEEEA